MAMDCVEWCRNSWQKSVDAYEWTKHAWANTKQKVRAAFLWIWLMFLAVVAAEESGEKSVKSGTVNDIEIEKDPSKRIEVLDAEIEENSGEAKRRNQENYEIKNGAAEKRESISIGINESPDEVSNDVWDEGDKVLQVVQSIDFKNREKVECLPTEISFQKRERYPLKIDASACTIVEEDEEEEEEDQEEKEKQWRVANGGLIRSAGLENLSIKSESCGDDLLNNRLTSGKDAEIIDENSVKCEVLWQTLVAKYASDDKIDKLSENENAKAMKATSFDDSDSSTMLKTDSSTMSDLEFSVAVGKRLEEILANDNLDTRKESTEPNEEEEVMEDRKELFATQNIGYSIGENFSATHRTISDDGEKSLHKFIPQKTTKPDIRSLRIETIDESQDDVQPIFIIPKISLLDNDEAPKPEPGRNSRPNLRSLRIETLDESEIDELNVTIKATEPVRIELPQDENETLVESDACHSQMYDSKEIVSFDTIPRTLLKEPRTETIMEEPLEEEKYSDATFTEHILETSSEKEIEKDKLNDAVESADVDERVSEEDYGEEVAVVADFSFKLRPKERDTLKFGIKEETASGALAIDLDARSSPPVTANTEIPNVDNEIERPVSQSDSQSDMIVNEDDMFRGNVARKSSGTVIVTSFVFDAIPFLTDEMPVTMPNIITVEPDNNIDYDYLPKSELPIDSSVLPEFEVSSESCVHPELELPLDLNVPPESDLPLDSNVPPESDLPLNSNVPPESDLPLDSNVLSDSDPLLDTTAPHESEASLPSNALVMSDSKPEFDIPFASDSSSLNLDVTVTCAVPDPDLQDADKQEEDFEEFLHDVMRPVTQMKADEDIVSIAPFDNEIPALEDPIGDIPYGNLFAIPLFELEANYHHDLIEQLERSDVVEINEGSGNHEVMEPKEMGKGTYFTEHEKFKTIGHKTEYSQPDGLNSNLKFKVFPVNESERVEADRETLKMDVELEKNSTEKNNSSQSITVIDREIQSENIEMTDDNIKTEDIPKVDDNSETVIISMDEPNKYADNALQDDDFTKTATSELMREDSESILAESFNKQEENAEIYGDNTTTDNGVYKVISSDQHTVETEEPCIISEDNVLTKDEEMEIFVQDAQPVSDELVNEDHGIESTASELASSANIIVDDFENDESDEVDFWGTIRGNEDEADVFPGKETQREFGENYAAEPIYIENIKSFATTENHSDIAEDLEVDNEKDVSSVINNEVANEAIIDATEKVADLSKVLQNADDEEGRIKSTISVKNFERPARIIGRTKFFVGESDEISDDDAEKDVKNTGTFVDDDVAAGYSTTGNLFSDTVVDETFNIILDKEASMEADESSASIKKGILDTTVYDLDSTCDSKDVFEADSNENRQAIADDNVESEMTIGAIIASHLRKTEEVNDDLSDISDLLSSTVERKKHLGDYDDNYSEDSPDEKDKDDQRLMTVGLTAEEEAELAELAEFDKEKTEGEFREYMRLPPALTQQELEELALIQEEKESAQATREAERKELEKFLSMPVGLTEREQQELADLLAEEAEESEISAATEERLATFLAAARAESGLAYDEDDEDVLDGYMNMPDRLTEEEEMMLREGTDGEVDVYRDEEYREMIRKKFLSELEDDEDRVLLDEYEFAEQYGSDFEYDENFGYDDEDFLEEDDIKGVSDTKPEVKCADISRAADKPVVPPRKSKSTAPTVDKEFSKYKHFGSKSAEASTSKEAKPSMSSDQNKQDSQKKFFRLGALGIKKKKKEEIITVKCVENDFQDLKSEESVIQFKGVKNDVLDLVKCQEDIISNKGLNNDSQDLVTRQEDIISAINGQDSADDQENIGQAGKIYLADNSSADDINFIACDEFDGNSGHAPLLKMSSRDEDVSVSNKTDFVDVDLKMSSSYSSTTSPLNVTASADDFNLDNADDVSSNVDSFTSSKNASSSKSASPLSSVGVLKTCGVSATNSVNSVDLTNHLKSNGVYPKASSLNVQSCLVKSPDNVNIDVLETHAETPDHLKLQIFHDDVPKKDTVHSLHGMDFQTGNPIFGFNGVNGKSDVTGNNFQFHEEIGLYDGETEHPSLQDLIEAELSSRFSLQMEPDSLEVSAFANLKKFDEREICEDSSIIAHDSLEPMTGCHPYSMDSLAETDAEILNHEIVTSEDIAEENVTNNIQPSVHIDEPEAMDFSHLKTTAEAVKPDSSSELASEFPFENKISNEASLHLKILTTFKKSTSDSTEVETQAIALDTEVSEHSPETKVSESSLVDEVSQDCSEKYQGELKIKSGMNDAVIEVDLGSCNANHSSSNVCNKPTVNCDSFVGANFAHETCEKNGLPNDSDESSPNIDEEITQSEESDEMSDVEKMSGAENGEEGEEIIEERKEYVTNPDGTVTVKTIRVISTYVEEEEEVEEGEEETNKDKINEEKEEDEEQEKSIPPMPSFSDLSQEEREDFMRFAAEKKLMAKMEAAGFVPPANDDEDGKLKKKKKRPDGEKKGKKKKKRGDGKENKMEDLGVHELSSTPPSGDSFDEISTSTNDIEIASNIQNSMRDERAQLSEISSMENAYPPNSSIDRNENGCKQFVDDEGIEVRDVLDFQNDAFVAEDERDANVHSASTEENRIGKAGNFQENFDAVKNNSRLTEDSMEQLRHFSSVSEPAEISSVADDQTDSTSQDADLSQYMDENSDVEIDDEISTEEQKDSNSQLLAETELYNIDVKKLATSFLSTGSDCSVNSSVVEDLPANLPNISHLVEAYRNSSPKTPDPSQPSDIPAGLSLKSFKTAYETCAAGAECKKADSVVQDEGLHLNFSQMRAAYCNVISQSRTSSPSNKSELTNGRSSQSIKELTRSYSDLPKLHQTTKTILQEIPGINSNSTSVQGQHDIKTSSCETLTIHDNSYNGTNDCTTINVIGNRDTNDFTTMNVNGNRNMTITRQVFDEFNVSSHIDNSDFGITTLDESRDRSPDSAVHNSDSDDRIFIEECIHESKNLENFMNDSTGRHNSPYEDYHSDFEDDDSESNSGNSGTYELRDSLNKILCRNGWYGRENDASSTIFISVRQLRASYGDLTALTDTSTNEASLYDKLKRDDILAKHVGPRVRSFDSAKMKTKFEKPKEPTMVSSDCRACGKQVFQMEKIVAEKASWHKNCFRCKECNKNLTLETYQSHEGTLYCKPHFKDLFRPKAVVEDPTEARKERLLRRPKLIVLESNPVELPDDVVRATSKPDYGLEELQTLNVKQRFSIFENATQEQEVKLEPVSVRRSQSLISRAARFLAQNGSEDYGVDNCELGEYEDEEEEEGDVEEGEEETEEEEEEEVEEGVDEDGQPIITKTTTKKKKTKRVITSGMKDAYEKRSRRDEMSKMRKEELGRFRQMLCAGKNTTLKERFESGQFENEDKNHTKNKEEIKIDEKRAARSLKEKFEKGQPFCLDEENDDVGRRHVGEKEEVEEIFKEAGEAGRLHEPQTPTGDIVRCHDAVDDDPQVETQDLASKFMFFATFEQRQKQEAERKRKVFRITPPREAQVPELPPELVAKTMRRCMAVNCAVCKLRGLATDDVELGRDPNLIRCTDNYQDEVDCRKTKSILTMFKKMEARNTGAADDEEESDIGPRPLHRFTPPPEGEDYDDEYSDEEGEYTDEEGEYSDEEEDEEGGAPGKAPYKDELLQMLSARKAAELRAKFEKWEAEVDRHNDINKSNGVEDEEAMPSLDTARNLKAMFEEKAQEAAKPQVRERAKVNRFVGGGGDQCPACSKTVYAMEKFEVQGKIIHKTCFKCCKCNSPLSMVTFTMGGGKLYCNSHYKQLFTEKGNYDSILSGSGASTVQQ
ncbi:uncharacterized protein LOC125177988 [Hyalella azteca]|uniref:Uncharacterized protein LOC125177988 n=1 Tax=Hyalella azteca TaxID=294128 RepID=A0A979FKI6_HYAAZ|nr:uncharacterized protein LOC125177988 [Hyalella azteca]